MTLLLAFCGDGHSPNAPGDDSEDLSLVEEDGGRGDGVGTLASGEPNPSTPISSVEALVAQLSESASVLVRILVEGAGTDDTVYDKAWIEIVAATQISFDGETFAPPTLADLATGRQVQVIFIGPVRESYSVQAVARTVLIYR